jgi:hypothetical protein
MYLTKDGRVFTVSNIRGLDDKTPLPRVQNGLAPNESPTTVEEKNAAVVNSFIAPARLLKTPAAFIGGLGLFLILIGWHRLRRARK